MIGMKKISEVMKTKRYKNWRSLEKNILCIITSIALFRSNTDKECDNEGLCRYLLHKQSINSYCRIF